MRVAAVVLLITFVLMFGCGGGSFFIVTGGAPRYIQQTCHPLLTQRWVALPNFDKMSPGGIPDSLEPRSPAAKAYEVDLFAYEGSSGLMGRHDFGSCIQLKPYASGKYAWVMYAGGIPAGEKLSELWVDVDDAMLGGDELHPELPWWVGFANFNTGTWEWHGPYEGFMASPSVNHSLHRETYLDGNGFAHWVILSYCPFDVAPATMSIWDIDVATEDVPLE